MGGLRPPPGSYCAISAVDAPTSHSREGFLGHDWFYSRWGAGAVARPAQDDPSSLRCMSRATFLNFCVLRSLPPTECKNPKCSDSCVWDWAESADSLTPGRSLPTAWPGLYLCQEVLPGLPRHPGTPRDTPGTPPGHPRDTPGTPGSQNLEGLFNNSPSRDKTCHGFKPKRRGGSRGGVSDLSEGGPGAVPDTPPRTWGSREARAACCGGVRGGCGGGAGSSGTVSEPPPAARFAFSGGSPGFYVKKMTPGGQICIFRGGPPGFIRRK